MCSECGSRHYKAKTLVKHIKLNHPPLAFTKIFDASIKAWCEKWGYSFDWLRDSILSEAEENSV